ncbi:GntR family transcriptional regulator, partial [Neisseria sp. P0022.S006]
DYGDNTDVAPATSLLVLEERHDSELFRVYAFILGGIIDHLLLPGRELVGFGLCWRVVCLCGVVCGVLLFLVCGGVVGVRLGGGVFVWVLGLGEVGGVFSVCVGVEGVVLSVFVGVFGLGMCLGLLCFMVG